MPNLFVRLSGALAVALTASALPAQVQAQSQAQAVQAFVATDLNQRAGPSTRFPVLLVAPANAQVTIFGCLSDQSWCDGMYQQSRGWFSARYLQIPYQGTTLPVATYVRYAYLPAVSFNIDSYWSAYYPSRPFYAQLAVYASGGRASASINIGSFYRPLSPHGSWVELRGRYVWVPDVPSGWRPYTQGHWAFTRTHGWTWVSDEPFGWATYHYGRWAYSDRIGWFWVPGTRWAPAWVAWRQSDDYLAWAPLPPDPQDSFGLSVNISLGNIPNYYWQAVQARDFQETNLANVVIGDNNQVTNIVNQTQVIGNSNVVNNTVVNNVISINFVEEKTQRRVVEHDLALTADEGRSGQVQGDTIELYQPSTEALAPEEAPDEVKPVEQVAQQNPPVGQTGEPSTEDLVPPPPPPGEEPPPTELPGGNEPSGESQEEAGPPPAPPANLPAGGPEPCPAEQTRLPDGSCGEPPASPPPAEQVGPQGEAQPDAPPQAPEQPQPPAPPEQPQLPQTSAPPEQPQPPAQPEQPQLPQPPVPPEQPQPPAPPEQPPAPPELPQEQPCPEGNVVNPQGECVPAQQQEPAVPPEQPQPPQPPAPPEQPTPQAAPEPPQPPAAPEPPPQLPEPPPQQVQPTQPPDAPAPCPEGYVVNQQGECVLPPPQQ